MLRPRRDEVLALAFAHTTTTRGDTTLIDAALPHVV